MTQAESMAAAFALYREKVAVFNGLPSLPDSDATFKRHLSALRRADKAV